MNDTIRQTNSNCSISVIVTGSALMDNVNKLQSDPDKSIYLASDLSDAMLRAETLASAIVLTEHWMLAGVDLNTLRIRLALRRSVRILVFMDDAGDTRRRELLLAGIAGFLEPRQSAASTRRAIREVANGGLWASRRLLSEAVRSMVSVGTDPRFTKRELEILRRIADGQENQTIADSLFITRETVRWHLRSAYGKLGVHDRRSVVDMMRRSA